MSNVYGASSTFSTVNNANLNIYNSNLNKNTLNNVNNNNGISPTLNNYINNTPSYIPAVTSSILKPEYTYSNTLNLDKTTDYTGNIVNSPFISHHIKDAKSITYDKNNNNVNSSFI
jgi:hypothetical protein